MGVNKFVALTIAGATSGLLSVMGSLAIIYNILCRNAKTRLDTTYHRIMFALSIMDIFASISGSLSTLPAPSDTEGIYAFGNTATCTAQGFFTLFPGTSGIFYNFFLTIHFLLTICYNFSEHRMHKKIEPFFHLIALGYPLTTSLAGLYLKMFNYAGHRCWIAAYPTGCTNNDSVECTRGIHYVIFRWVSIGWLMIFTIIALPPLMMFIIWTVWTRERELKKKYGFTSAYQESSSVWLSCWCCVKTKTDSRPKDEYMSNPVVLTRTKTVATQCSLYMSVFMLTYIWSFILRILETKGKAPFFLQVLATIFYPLQGFFNYLVFIRRQVMRLRAKCPEYTLLQAFVEATFHPTRCDNRTKRFFSSRLSTIHHNKSRASLGVRETRDSEQICQGEGKKYKKEKKSDDDHLDEEPECKASNKHDLKLEDDIESQSSHEKYEKGKCDNCQFDTGNNEIIHSTEILNDNHFMDKNNELEVVQDRAHKIEDFDVVSDDNNNVL